MGKPDALSRRADHGSGSEDNSNITLLTPRFFPVRALEGLEAIGEEQDIFKDIRKGTRDAEKEEAIARVRHGQPWGFPGKPAPVPLETRTRSQGYGFWGVRVRV